MKGRLGSPPAVPLEAAAPPPPGASGVAPRTKVDSSAPGHGNPLLSQRLGGVRAQAMAPGAIVDGRVPADAELLRRAAARDERAVVLLHRTHAQKVRQRVARILGAHDSDIDDVVQHVFIAALDGAAGFDGRSSVGTWLLGIATRRALDHGRARVRRNRWHKITELVGLGRAPERPDHGHSKRDQVEAALSRLSPDQRVVFVLHDVEGHTFSEIADLTGAKVSTLHARLASARKILDGVVAAWAEAGSDHG